MAESHLIHKILVEGEADDEVSARRVSESAERELTGFIFPEMERIMDKMAGTSYLMIDRLDLDVGPVPEDRFEEEFAGRLLQAFREKMENAVNEASIGKYYSRGERESVRAGKTGDGEAPSTATADIDKAVSDTFLHWLNTGLLPWWSSPSGDWIREEIVSQSVKRNAEEVQRELVLIFVRNPLAITRLILRYSAGFAVLLLLPLLAGRVVVLLPELKEWLFRIIRPSMPGERPTLQQATRLGNMLSDLLRRAKIEPEELQAAEENAGFNKVTNREEQEDLETHIPGIKWEERISDREGQKGTEEKKERRERETGAQGIYVAHAGLALLHPFIPAFFEEAGLLDGKKFRNETSRITGVMLLNFLVTGREEAMEHDMVMEKYLCGYPLEAPVEAHREWSGQIREEVLDLLSTVIRHWTALKSTTPEGLREAFLQREGKLERGLLQHRLTVDAKSFDILLDRLPWGIGVIRLPWMQQPLHVEWTH